MKLSEVSRRTVSWLVRLAVNDAEMTMEKNINARLTRRTAHELPSLDEGKPQAYLAPWHCNTCKVEEQCMTPGNGREGCEQRRAVRAQLQYAAWLKAGHAVRLWQTGFITLLPVPDSLPEEMLAVGHI